MPTQSRRLQKSIPMAVSAPLADIQDSRAGLDSIVSLRMLESASSKAIISFNKMALHDPPLPLQFSTQDISDFNPAYMVELADVFHRTGFKSFTWHSMIPVLLSRGDLDASCINTDMTLGIGSPFLTLSEAGEMRGHIAACDGYHRYRAVEHVRAYLTTRIDELYEQVMEQSRVEHFCRLWGRQELVKVRRKGERVWNMLQQYEQEKTWYETCGIVVYDLDIVNQENLGPHLGCSKVFKYHAGRDSDDGSHEEREGLGDDDTQAT